MAKEIRGKPILNTFRWIVAFFTTAPVVFLYIIMSIFIKKANAERIVGKILASFAAKTVELALPKVHSKEDFRIFKRKVIRVLTVLSKPMYDVKVEHEDDESVEFKVMNCHFVAVLKILGTAELCKYACAGDFKIAHKNESKWKFRRTHEFGTDGVCCNPKYYAVDSTINPDKK